MINRRTMFLTSLLIFAVGCLHQQDLYQRPTGEMMQMILEASSRKTALSTNAENGKLAKNNSNTQDKAFDFFAVVPIGPWFKFANLNSPDVLYVILVLNGSSESNYTGGQIPIDVGNEKK